MRLFASRTDRWRGIFALLCVAVGFGVLYLSIREYAPFLFDPQLLRTWVGQFGIFAPIVFVIIQAAQVVIAPIPGQVIALIAGYLFGPVAGTVYSFTGVLIGSTIAFLLTKRYGRTFAENVLHDDVLTRFDGFVERVGIPGLLLFVLIPGLPDDIICFLSGLTTWSLRTFLVVITIGRLPAYFLTVYAGGQLASGDFASGLTIIAIVVFFSLVGYYNQDAIRTFVKRLSARDLF
ncbi:TVP38/TMEM64 family protein [Halovenus sp. HT40]|uniref:TVP38/TMEM64 family protein n=1 Tax=Halovenus sp. HT40 TaxID=3126691 RepID=UPI003FA56E2A